MKTISKKELIAIGGGYGLFYCIPPLNWAEIIRNLFRSPPYNPTIPSSAS